MRKRAEALRAEARAVPADALAQAVEAESRRRVESFLRGVQAYRLHPYARALEDPPVLWREGGTRLLDYGPEGGLPLLVVPSLINRGYILDLTARRSLLRYLAARGVRPFLLDWGAPAETERGFALDDYVAGRLVRACDTVTERAGRPALLGYCMGGTLAVALATLRPVRALALLAAPWDFHAGQSPGLRALVAAEDAVSRGIDAAGELPIDVLQALFAGIEPGSVVRKFRSFAAMPKNSARARAFVAVEDWLNDGVPLTAGVAKDCLFGWYGRNEPALGRWRIGGAPVHPERIETPALVIVPLRDRIVPPESALALAKALPRARRKMLPAGHIGLVTGRRAATDVYGPLARWLTHVALQ